jgi:hypothetical protein
MDELELLESSLDLTGHRFGDEGAAALADSPCLCEEIRKE